jgi:hypothetical protein
MPSKTFNINQFENWANRNVNEIQKVAESIVQDAIIDGASVMREHIMTRGTNKEWGSFWPSRAQGRKSRSTEARFDTGEMRDAVDSQMLRSSRSFVAGEFGWINKEEDYFRYQEKGFTHRNGAVIPAMNALRDARTYAISVVEKEMKRMFG